MVGILTGWIKVEDGGPGSQPPPLPMPFAMLLSRMLLSRMTFKVSNSRHVVMPIAIANKSVYFQKGQQIPLQKVGTYKIGGGQLKIKNLVFLNIILNFVTGG